jgi:hypothetical protein
MRNGAVARHAETRLVRIGLEPCNQTREILCIDSRADGDAEFKSRQQRHRHEILVTIEGRIRLHHRQQKHGRPGGDKYRGPVRSGTLDRLDPDQPAAAVALLHDDGAVERLADLLSEQPAQRVAAAAGREGKDDFCQRTLLGLRHVRFRQQRQTETAGNELSAIHSPSPRRFGLLQQTVTAIGITSMGAKGRLHP